MGCLSRTSDKPLRQQPFPETLGFSVWHSGHPPWSPSLHAETSPGATTHRAHQAALHAHRTRPPARPYTRGPWPRRWDMVTAWTVSAEALAANTAPCCQASGQALCFNRARACVGILAFCFISLAGASCGSRRQGCRWQLEACSDTWGGSAFPEHRWPGLG